MWRRCAMASFAALSIVAACGIEGERPRDGARGSCAEGVDCEPVAVTGAEDACWRMVQCRAVPVANPESDPSCCFDWAACVHQVEALPDDEFEQALACIESSTCDELRPIHRGQMPRCLEQL